MARRLGTPCQIASILRPMYRRVDEMVNRRAVEARGGDGDVAVTIARGGGLGILFSDEWKKIGAREWCF